MNEPIIKTVPICLTDNKRLLIKGEVYGIYSVAPILLEKPHLRVLSKGGWCVRSVANGLNLAAFKSREVATNFAIYLWETFGDITPTLHNCYNNCETPKDAALLDAIQARSKHETRIVRGDVVPYIPAQEWHVPKGGKS